MPVAKAMRFQGQDYHTCEGYFLYPVIMTIRSKIMRLVAATLLKMTTEFIFEEK